MRFSSPILVALLLAGSGRALRSQTTPLPNAAVMRSEPAGAPLGTIRPRAQVKAEGGVRAGFSKVKLEGYVLVRAVVERPGGELAVVVRSPAGAVLRATPASHAAAMATLRRGTPLERISRNGEWLLVRARGWIPSLAFDVRAPKADSRQPPATAPAAGKKARSAVRLPVGNVRRSSSSGEVGAPAAAGLAEIAIPTPVESVSLVPARPSAIRDIPDGQALATVSQRAVLTPIARDRGWVRVRVEGWMPEADLQPADTALRAAVSAADLRSDPDGTRGKLVRWRVDVLALQTADALRRDLAPEEPYLLARGPGDENALLYLAVPPTLLSAARALPKPGPVVITARVRNGRSEPVGVPILDLQSVARP